MEDTYTQIRKILDEKDVTLVAVSKTFPIETILETYEKGQRIFGENKVQELRQKQEALPSDIHWHFIGSLQRNKVKYIAPFIALIHSLDSISLAQEISKRAIQNNRIIPALIQVKVAEEESKQGVSRDDLDEFVQALQSENLPGLRINGIMGMGTLTTDKAKTKKEFEEIRGLYDYLKSTYFMDHDEFLTISMGMSSDYIEAIESGSTMVRIGSLIFGHRNKI